MGISVFDGVHDSSGGNPTFTLSVDVINDRTPELRLDSDARDFAASFNEGGLPIAATGLLSLADADSGGLLQNGATVQIVDGLDGAEEMLSAESGDTGIAASRASIASR